MLIALLFYEDPRDRSTTYTYLASEKSIDLKFFCYSLGYGKWDGDRGIQITCKDPHTSKESVVLVQSKVIVSPIMIPLTGTPGPAP